MCKSTHTDTHLSFVLATLYAPLSCRAAEGLQLLLHDHQPLLYVQQTVVEALVVIDAVLTLMQLCLQTAEKDQWDSQRSKVMICIGNMCNRFSQVKRLFKFQYCDRWCTTSFSVISWWLRWLVVVRKGGCF